MVTPTRTNEGLCLTYVDTFVGNSPVTHYSVNITDDTGLSYYFTQPKVNDTACMPIPTFKENLVRDSCGNLNLTVKSINAVGESPSFTTIIQGNSCKSFLGFQF